MCEWISVEKELPPINEPIYFPIEDDPNDFEDKIWDGKQWLTKKTWSDDVLIIRDHKIPELEIDSITLDIGFCYFYEDGTIIWSDRRRDWDFSVYYWMPIPKLPDLTSIDKSLKS